MNRYINHITNIELNISLYCNKLTSNNNFIFYFYRIITSTADWWMYLIYAFLLLLISNYETAINAIIFGSLAYFFHYPIYYAIKNITKRKRPFDQKRNNIKCFVKPPDKYSMPSGHTSGITITTLTIIYYFPVVTKLLLIWPLLIALSRIFLGVHYPSDTIIGCILGFICYYIAYLILI